MKKIVLKKFKISMLTFLFFAVMHANAWAIHWELQPTGQYGPVSVGDIITLHIILVNDDPVPHQIEAYGISFEYDGAELDWNGNYGHTLQGDLLEDLFGPPQDEGNQIWTFNAGKLPTGIGYELAAGESTDVGWIEFEVLAVMQWDSVADISLYYRYGIDGFNYDHISEEIPCTQQGPDVGIAEALPDLEVTQKSEVWNDSSDPSQGYDVSFTILNSGTAAAVANAVSLNVDGSDITTVNCPALAVGESYNGTFDDVSYSAPSDTIIVCVDSGNIVIEDNEENNCFENVLSGYPNLVVTAKEENWNSENTYRVLYTIENSGGAYEGTSYANVTIDGMEMGRILTPTLAPGESINGVFGPFEYTGPEDTIIVCADSDGEITESVEADNCLENQLIPDLTITWKSEQWNSDGSYNVNFTLQNAGNAPVPALSKVAVYIDGDTIPEQVIAIPIKLLPGESTNGVFESLVCSPISDTVMVCADYNDEIEESDETNNCMENTWDCFTAPDLVISGMSVVNFDSHKVHFTVMNIGNDVAGESTVELTVGGVSIGTVEITDLGPGESETGSFINIGDPGDALVQVCADSLNAVEEMNEDNNCASNQSPTATLDVRNGVGAPGSKDRVVQINLENVEAVGGVQVDVMDAGDFLMITGAKAADRAMISGLTCSFTELENGAARVLLAGTGSSSINAGNGPVITLEYSVTSDALQGCIALDPINIKVMDADGAVIVAKGNAGKFSINSGGWGDVYPAASCGDGIVDLFDVLEEIDFALGATPLDCQFIAGDVPTGTPPNSVQPDENINILDVLVVIDKVLGLPNSCDDFQ